MLQTRNSLDPIESTNISHSSPKLDAISISFTSLPFLVETLEVLKQGEAITPEMSRHKPKPAPTKEHKSKPPLPWHGHKQKTLQRPNCWYVPFRGPRKVLVAKKHRNWIRHPKWFTLDLKMPKQVVGMLQYYLWDDDALPTSLTTQLA